MSTPNTDASIVDIAYRAVVEYAAPTHQIDAYTALKTWRHYDELTEQQTLHVVHKWPETDLYVRDPAEWLTGHNPAEVEVLRQRLGFATP